jgi:hypothetical protein
MNNPPLLRPRLRSPGSIPYGGRYKLDRPDLGMVGEGSNFDSLMAKIRAYRHANAFPNGLGLEDEVQEELCKIYSAECCETDVRIPTRHKRTWREIVQGTQVMLRHKLAGSTIVDQSEAVRRAQICLKCPNNVAFEMQCSGLCAELKAIVLSLVGPSTSTGYEPNLHACAVCSCELSASVWVPLDIQTQGLTIEQQAQFRTAKELHGCWKAENL